MISLTVFHTLLIYLRYSSKTSERLNLTEVLHIQVLFYYFLISFFCLVTEESTSPPIPNLIYQRSTLVWWLHTFSVNTSSDLLTTWAFPCALWLYLFPCTLQSSLGFTSHLLNFRLNLGSFSHISTLWTCTWHSPHTVLRNSLHPVPSMNSLDSHPSTEFLKYEWISHLDFLLAILKVIYSLQTDMSEAPTLSRIPLQANGNWSSLKDFLPQQHPNWAR